MRIAGLRVKAKALLESRDNERLLSIASIWEIAIKASLRKLTFRKPLEEFIPEQIAVGKARPAQGQVKLPDKRSKIFKMLNTLRADAVWANNYNKFDP